MKEIKIIVYGKEDGKLNGMIDINSEDYQFDFCDTGEGLKGTQCRYVGGTPEFERVDAALRKVSENIKIAIK